MLTIITERIPQEDFVEDCAWEHGVEFSKLNGCMSQDDGEFSLGMLRDSFNRSQKVGATKSCTVRPFKIDVLNTSN